MALQGNIPVIPTPFLNGEVDYGGFDRMIEHTSAHVDGYVVAGSTGEAPALSKQERIDIVRHLARIVPQDKELVVGLGHTNLREAIDIGRSAKEAGVRSALVPSPYYFPNSPAMVTEYMAELGEKTALDIVFYDNPVTTGTKYTAQELLDMAKAVPAIKAVKMTDHHFGKMRELKRQSALKVFGGDDIICFRSFEAGVDGSMIIAPIIYPEAFRASWDAYCARDRETSYRIFSQTILPFIHMFGPGDEIPTTKALYYKLGIFQSAETRLPLLSSDEQRVREVMLGYEAGLAAIRS
ncbi:dihydrodipicolinate synthase family protein [Cohnella soli]|uniref:Dihydrodipicolinate synthase family protein n=1 Tax=Cohnella soli TaxID=425005 RepID=A0ABW0HRM3_9BACL